jgi:hypothetical protein
MKMRKIKTLFVGLALSLVILSGIAVEQTISANLPGGDLGCQDLTGCKNLLSCGTRGTPSGCTIECEGGGTITCPK